MNKKKEVKMSNLTVLLLTTEYRDNIVGGLGRHVTDLCIEGSNRGTTYIVVTVSNTDKESYIIEQGIHVFRLLPWQRNPKDFLEYIRNINFRFSQFVLQELHLSFDLIHAHDWLTGIAATQLKTIMKRPLISTIHATENGRKQGKESLLSNRITEYECELVKRSDRVIVCSYFMKEAVNKEFACSLEKIKVIPNGIIPTNYKSYMQEKEAIVRFPFIQTPYLLGMGRLVEEKGFHLFLQAFAAIHKEFPNLITVIAGEGPGLKELKRVAEILKVANKVIFTGFVHELERNTLLKSCEMIIIPSLYEPFGIISLEGMVASKPTVSFKIGGLAEVLRYNRGILIEEVTSKALADKLQVYLTRPEKLENVAAAGFEAANTIYNWSNIIDDIVELYITMLKSSPKHDYL